MIDVILPCLNEAGALPQVLGQLPPGYRAIVVDNGSTDGSAEVARRYGAQVVPAAPLGFGAACQAGLRAATSEVVALMDADASLDPRELPAITGPVLAGAADLVLGRRYPCGPRAWPWHARAANAALARLIRQRTGLSLRDLGPMRAARRTELAGLDLRDLRFGFPLEMVLTASAAGWRITEVPVAYRPRIGTSKVTGTVRGTQRAIADMRKVLRDADVRARATPVNAGQGTGHRPGEDPAVPVLQP